MPQFENFDPDTYPIKLTNTDICLRTFNPIEVRILEVTTKEERDTFLKLKAAVSWKEAEMDKEQKQTGNYAGEDQKELVQMQIEADRMLDVLQAKYKIVAPNSRSQANLVPRDGFGNVPFGFANMVRVTGKRMGEGAARRGSWAVFPQGKSERKVREFISHVQTRHPRFLTPVTGTPETSIRDALFYLQKRPLGNIIVTDESKKILRIIDETLLKQNEKLDEEMELGQIPLPSGTQNIVTAPEDVAMDDALRLMDQAHINFLPIVSVKNGTEEQLRWVLTRKEAEMQQEFPAHKDEKGRLATVVAVSMFREGWDKRVIDLIQQEVTAIVLDSPHAYQGHSGALIQKSPDQKEEEKIEFRKRVLWTAQQIKASGRNIRLIVGNVDDPDAVRRIIAAAVEGGMDPKYVTVKVGIGPGHACITREEAGMGMPQWSAVYECAQVALRMGANVQADGGASIPADIAKYIAAGASHVMLGSKGVPLAESPAVLKEDSQGMFGVNFGMGSDVFSQLREDAPRANTSVGTYNEGLRDQRVYRTPGINDVSDFVARFGRGLRSNELFFGAKNLADAYKYARICLQNASGFQEGLGKAIVK